MNLNAFFDCYTIQLTRILLRKNRWFARSISSVSLPEHVQKIPITPLTIDGEGFYEQQQDSLAGILDPAFHIVRWLGPQYPTIIYHHGNNESPFNYRPGSKNTFKSIFLAAPQLMSANLISLRAPYHRQGLKAYLEKMTDLNAFAAMLAGSVQMVESLIRVLRKMGTSQVIVAGMSLGGWVANLHRAIHDSAEYYIPIFAGAALDDLFTSSIYGKLAGQLAQQHPETMKQVLNFEQVYQKISSCNIYPMLARHDQIIRLERQIKCYGETPVAVIEKGHITGALAAKAIRQHVAKVLAYASDDTGEERIDLANG